MCILLVETKKNILFIPIDWQQLYFLLRQFRRDKASQETLQ